MANKKYYDALPDIVLESMNDVAKYTGRKYKLFDYYGSKNPEHVFINKFLISHDIYFIKLLIINFINKTGNSYYGIRSLDMF